jgi:hypothetical protein
MDGATQSNQGQAELCAHTTGACINGGRKTSITLVELGRNRGRDFASNDRTRKHSMPSSISHAPDHQVGLTFGFGGNSGVGSETIVGNACAGPFSSDSLSCDWGQPSDSGSVVGSSSSLGIMAYGDVGGRAGANDVAGSGGRS